MNGFNSAMFVFFKLTKINSKNFNLANSYYIVLRKYRAKMIFPVISTHQSLLNICENKH